MERNFYGDAAGQPVETRSASGRRSRKLYHGSIQARRAVPSPTRCGANRRATTGATQASARDRRRAAGQPLRVGLIGLGAGTLAAYGRGPATSSASTNSTRGLRAGRSRVQLPQATARATSSACSAMPGSAGREPPQRFDVLAVDAFSGDSIPGHLITTRGAGCLSAPFATRRRDRLSRQQPLPRPRPGWSRRLAAASSLTALHFVDEPPEDSRNFRTDWIALTANAATATLLQEAGGKVMDPDPAVDPLWTDDHHNLFEVLK